MKIYGSKFGLSAKVNHFEVSFNFVKITFKCLYRFQ